ncbi:MAG: polyprenyl synthetase family protein [Endozoicomonas sp. (ex Botrylloides leachii)]|nr:polyprenyl synthetase family protein [Endozoicomonas sp. (ex Botrylloides leachii)]
MSLDDFMGQCCQRVDSALYNVLPNNNDLSKTLIKAMNYCVFNGGKRIRPLLTYAACQSVGGHFNDADPAACSVELVHAYSLVHDDLPALDNDNWRRGKPTCHKAYDEATAILVGDALQSMAFEVLSHNHLLPHAKLSDTQRLLQMQSLSAAIGHAGMVGGQAMDLRSVGLALTQEQLIQMHSHKTGALIKSCVKMGALCNPEVTHYQLEQLDKYATSIGLSFQVQDDILDVTSETEILGKAQGADEALAKPTSVSVLGLEQAQVLASNCCQSALSAITNFGSAAEPLRQLAGYVIKRAY